MTRNGPAWIGITVIFAAALYLAATIGIQAPGTQTDAASRLAGATALLIVIAGAAGFGYRPTVHLALRQTLAWLAVGLAGLVLFAHRAEIGQVGGGLLADTLPIGVVAQEGATVPDMPADRNATSISAGRGGHFFVEAMVNGHHVRMVADTGATLVALTAEDAARVGLDPAGLDFVHRVRTANGIAHAAHVTLDEVTVGPITLHDVEASVSEAGVLNESLLGMSFLKRLSAFRMRGDLLVLQQ